MCSGERSSSRMGGDSDDAAGISLVDVGPMACVRGAGVRAIGHPLYQWHRNEV